jgi:hypothetical protein
MRPYVQKIAAGAREDYPVKGDYIRLKTASVPVTFEGRDSGFKVTLEQGDSVRLKEFQAVIVSHGDAAEQTVTFYVGNGESLDSSQVGGSVQVSNFPASAPSQVSPANSNPTVTSASAQLLAANAARKFLLIQNKDSVGRIYLNFGAGAATVANGLVLEPGEEFAPGIIPVNAIQAIGDKASNANITVLEG